MTTRPLPTHVPPTHPGEMLLEEFLKPAKVSLAAFAREIGVSYPRLHELVHGRRGMTTDTAMRIERATGMGAYFWMQLQLDWDLWHATHGALSPAVKKIKRLRAFASA